MKDARDLAHELMQVGRLLNDPRSTGFGLNLLSWIAFFTDSYAEALEQRSITLSCCHSMGPRCCYIGKNMCFDPIAAKTRPPSYRRSSVAGLLWMAIPLT